MEGSRSSELESNNLCYYLRFCVARTVSTSLVPILNWAVLGYGAVSEGFDLEARLWCPQAP